jgi:hypothetical protein
MSDLSVMESDEENHRQKVKRNETRRRKINQDYCEVEKRSRFAKGMEK